MSGRAGRRGLDDRGIVILMIDEKMSPGVGKNILQVRPGVRAIETAIAGTESVIPLFSNTKKKKKNEREIERIERKRKGKRIGKKRKVGKVTVLYL